MQLEGRARAALGRVCGVGALTEANKKPCQDGAKWIVGGTPHKGAEGIDGIDRDASRHPQRQRGLDIVFDVLDAAEEGLACEVGQHLVGLGVRIGFRIPLKAGYDDARVLG